MSKSTCCLFPLRVNVEFTPGKFQFYSGQTPSLLTVMGHFAAHFLQNAVGILIN